MFNLVVALNFFDKCNFKELQFNTFKEVAEYIESLKATKATSVFKEGTTQDPKSNQFQFVTGKLKPSDVSVKDGHRWKVVKGQTKIVKECLDFMDCITLDYDNGTPFAAVKEQLKDFECYYYSSYNNGKNGEEKFRFVLPLNKSISSEDYVKYKHTLLNYFKGCDQSTFARTRVFCAPLINPEYADIAFSGYQEGKQFDISKLEFSEAPRSTTSKVQASEILDDIDPNDPIYKEIEQKWMRPYMEAAEDEKVWGRGRNSAFFYAQKRIAEYHLKLEDHEDIARRMNHDSARNSVEKTVSTAREHVISIQPITLKRMRKEEPAWVILPEKKYIKDLNIELGDITLLMGQPGTGKSTTFCRDDWGYEVVFAVPNIPLGKQLSAKEGVVFEHGKEIDRPKVIKNPNVVITTWASLHMFDLKGKLLVIDEYHKTALDQYRASTIDGVFHAINFANAAKVVCLTGTYDVSAMKEQLHFDKVYKVKRQREVRKVNYIEATKVPATVLNELLKAKARGEKSMLLWDSLKELESISKMLKQRGITSLIMNAQTKDDEVFENLYSKGSFDADVLMHTQVLLEGVSIDDSAVKNMIAVHRQWSDWHLVQYFERLRLREEDFNYSLICTKSKDRDEPKIARPEFIATRQNELVKEANKMERPLAYLSSISENLGLAVDQLYSEIDGKVMSSYSYPFMCLRATMTSYDFFDLESLNSKLLEYDWSLNIEEMSSTKLTKADLELSQAAKLEYSKAKKSEKLKAVNYILQNPFINDAELTQLERTIKATVMEMGKSGLDKSDMLKVFNDDDDYFSLQYILKRKESKLFLALKEHVQVGDFLTKTDRSDIISNIRKDLEGSVNFTKELKDLNLQVKNGFENAAFKTFFTVKETRRKLDGKYVRGWLIERVGKFFDEKLK